MLTPKQFAELHGVSYPSVMKWLAKGLLAGAEKRTVPYGVGFFYLIPATVPRPTAKPGPRPGTKRGAKKRAAKKKGARK